MLFAERGQGLAIKLLAENRVAQGDDNGIKGLFGKRIADDLDATAAFEVIIEGHGIKIEDFRTTVPQGIHQDEGLGIPGIGAIFLEAAAEHKNAGLVQLFAAHAP